jgi:hypothetical protein
MPELARGLEHVVDDRRVVDEATTLAAVPDPAFRAVWFFIPVRRGFLEAPDTVDKNEVVFACVQDARELPAVNAERLTR